MSSAWNRRERNSTSRKNLSSCISEKEKSKKPKHNNNNNKNHKQKTPNKQKPGNRVVLWGLRLVRVTLPLHLLVLKLSTGSYPQNSICVCNSVQRFDFVHWELAKCITPCPSLQVLHSYSYSCRPLVLASRHGHLMPTQAAENCPGNWTEATTQSK